MVGLERLLYFGCNNSAGDVLQVVGFFTYYLYCMTSPEELDFAVE